MLIVVPLLSKRLERALVFQKAQHAIPALALLPAGVQSLLGGAHGFAFVLAIAEIATSAWLLRLVAVEIGAAARGVADPKPHHGPDWAHLAAASMITVEIFERWHTNHRWSRPLILTALVTFALGFLHGRITRLRESRMRLRVDDDGLEWRFKRLQLSPGGRFAARFEDIESFEIGATQAFLSANGTKVKLALGDLRNATEVRQVLDTARERWLASIAKRETEGRTQGTSGQ